MAKNNIYIRIDKNSLLVIVVYVDDIIFGCNNDDLSDKLTQDMSKMFEMSMIGDLSFSLGLKIN